MLISVIVPVYNESESLNELYESILSNLASLSINYELIFCDDGSEDGSLELMDQIAFRDPRVRVVSFRKNRGKSAVLTAGFSLASGDIAITIDGDLQDDPREFRHLLAKIDEGYDVVVGRKIKRQDPWSRRMASKIFNQMVYWITGCDLHDINCGLKALKKDFYQNLVLYGDLHRIIPVIAFIDGFRVGEIDVNHFPRKYGSSKYSVFRYRGILDLLSLKIVLSYRLRPFHFFGLWGLFIVCTGLLTMAITHTFIALVLGLFQLTIGLIFISSGLITEIIIHHSSAQGKDIILKNMRIITYQANNNISPTLSHIDEIAAH